MAISKLDITVLGANLTGWGLWYDVLWYMYDVTIVTTSGRSVHLLYSLVGILIIDRGSYLWSQLNEFRQHFFPHLLYLVAEIIRNEPLPTLGGCFLTLEMLHKCFPCLLFHQVGIQTYVDGSRTWVILTGRPTTPVRSLNGSSSLWTSSLSAWRWHSGCSHLLLSSLGYWREQCYCPCSCCQARQSSRHISSRLHLAVKLPPSNLPCPSPYWRAFLYILTTEVQSSSQVCSRMLGTTVRWRFKLALGACCVGGYFIGTQGVISRGYHLAHRWVQQRPCSHNLTHPS